MACTITAKKLGIKVAHVEAGSAFRGTWACRKRSTVSVPMSCVTIFYTTDRFADENLRREGVADEKIHFVGNVMIDTLLKHKQMAAGLGLATNGVLKLVITRP